MLDRLSQLDRRWVFLAMFLSVALPIIFQITFPEKATLIVQKAFDAVEDLPPGSKVLLAFDYDPASAGELDPMATAWVRHCCEKKHKMYFIALWPLGPRMIDDKISKVIKTNYPELKYGEDYVNLGFKSGNEGVIQVIVSDLKKLYTADASGQSLDDVPMTANMKSIQDIDLILNVSAGTPGTKEWVQYAATPYNIRTIGGCTGVQAPQLYPYYPNQMIGLLAAIKGAAEYEAALAKVYPRYQPAEMNEGLRRMSPQLVAHLLMILLIILGNVIYFSQKRKPTQIG